MPDTAIAELNYDNESVVYVVVINKDLLDITLDTLRH